MSLHCAHVSLHCARMTLHCAHVSLQCAHVSLHHANYSSLKCILPDVAEEDVSSKDGFTVEQGTIVEDVQTSVLTLRFVNNFINECVL